MRNKLKNLENIEAEFSLPMEFEITPDFDFVKSAEDESIDNITATLVIMPHVHGVFFQYYIGEGDYMPVTNTILQKIKNSNL